MSNNWYVVTGGPSSGISTLLKDLEKLGYKTIPEAARRLIDEALETGITARQLRADEKQFQEDVARRKALTEAEHNLKTVTFFDRGMHDTLAYMRHYGYNVERWVDDLLHKSTYKKVFLLEPLPHFEADYARTENHDFTKKIRGLLHASYSEYGMEPVTVPLMSPQERVKFVLSHIKQEQAA